MQLDQSCSPRRKGVAVCHDSREEEKQVASIVAQHTYCGIEVDDQHRAKRLKYFSLQKPHARAFHAAYLSFFAANFAVFAVPSLVTVMRNDLNLTDSQITNGAIASIAGTVAARLVMGTVCELLGPRLGSASVLLCCSSVTFGMALASNPPDFIGLRLLMGCAMAIFVHCQFWTSVMYSPPVVGVANGLAAGLANSGAGFAHLYCMGPMAAVGTTQPQFVAWRVTMLIPGLLMIGVALGVLAFTQDCPDGDYRQLRRSGALQRPSMAAAIREAAANYRMWLLAAVYASTFGCELTINNFIQQYLEDQFGLDSNLSGVLSSLFGITNIVARPFGGLFSDSVARWRGLPARRWVVAFLTALAGGACMALKPASGSLAATVVALVGTAASGMGSSGAVWGLVPFLGSRAALGVVAGVVGAAGPIGALVLSSAIMRTQPSKASGFFYIGLWELCTSPLALAILPPRPWRQQQQQQQQQQQHSAPAGTQPHRQRAKGEGGAEGGNGKCGVAARVNV